MPKILIIGSSNTDMVVKTSRLPKAGETLLGGDFFLFPGGKGANQAVAAARLGGEVTFVCHLGNDLFGKQAKANFDAEKIDTRHITFDAEKPSGVAVITVDEAAENTIVVAPGSNAYLSPQHIENLDSVFETTDIILTQLEIPFETTLAIVKLAKKHKKKLVINPAPARMIAQDVLLSLFLITPNESETALLTGIYPDSQETCETAAQALLDKGVRHVLITLGEKGAFFKSQTEQFRISSNKVKAIDTTAAGDVFNGALVVCLAKNMNWADVISFANNAAAISVTKMGAQSSAPYLSEL